MSAVEAVRNFVKFCKDFVELYEKTMELKKKYGDILSVKTGKFAETLLQLGEELGYHRFGEFLQAYLLFVDLLIRYKEKLNNFYDLSVEEQERIVKELKDAISMMEAALQ